MQEVRSHITLKTCGNTIMVKVLHLFENVQNT